MAVDTQGRKVGLLLPELWSGWGFSWISEPVAASVTPRFSPHGPVVITHSVAGPQLLSRSLLEDKNVNTEYGCPVSVQFCRREGGSIDPGGTPSNSEGRALSQVV